ncbi:unnamed protein product [Mortierella alpina]
MLNPAPSHPRSTSDSIASSYIPIPSIPTETDSWASTSHSQEQGVLRRVTSIPKARPSKLSRSSSLHRQHHHNRRPSKQFVATTSDAIFGDWNIDCKVERRKGSSSGGRPAATAAATAAAGGGGGGGSGSGRGPGIHTAASGLQPLSTLSAALSSPSQHSSTTSSAGPGLTALTPRMHQHSTLSSSSDRSSFKDTPSSPKLSRPMSPASRMSIEQGDEALPANALSSPTARSSFLKALGKFKSKHLQQKRSSAPPPGIDTLDVPTPSVTDRRASYIIPPITFGDTEARPAQDAAVTVTPPVERTEATEAAGDERVASVSSGTSSLRVKFKNKVNNKLALMRSSSNLREGMKDLSDSQRQAQRSDDLQASGTAGDTSNRHSRSAWSIPRIRPEPRQGSRPQAPWNAESSTTQNTSESPHPTKPSPMDSTVPPLTEHDSTTLDQQLKALKVEELDSDHSLDIILPADYEDYTQFAELPLKKRKKMERALAANLSADAAGSEKRPMSMKASADAVKRFLLSQQRQEAAKGRLQNHKPQDKDAADSVTVVAREMSPATINVNKKRPQSSTECADAASSVKKGGHQANDWRRSLMRSLHLGKGNGGARIASSQTANDSNKSSASSPLGTELDQPASKQQSGLEAGRLNRSGSVRTVRALSLTSSTHPALLATTVPKPRGQGLRRETLEMAMRRRRQSSVVTARSNISSSDIPPVPSRPAEFFDTDNASTTNITHTFTSFTLEFADMHHAHEVMNNSVVPGLFNFKARKPRLTVSSNIMMELDTDQEFRGFDSDGDAISGYTGDADVSMDDIQVHSPKLSSASRSGADHLKVRTREPSSAADISARRKMSSVDGDSDTITELPTLMIRTRDLNRSNSGGRGPHSGGSNNARISRPLSGSSFDVDQRDESENPRSPRRAGAVSPNTTPRAGRSALSINTDTRHAPSSPTKATRARMSMEEIVSWEPRDMYSHSTRPVVPALDTKPLKPTRGTATTSSAALASSSRAPLAEFMTQSPSVMTPASGLDNRGSSSRHHHQQSSSSFSTQYPSHQHQMSGDTLVPSHYKNFSSGSAMSASSEFSAHTLSGGRPQHYQYPSFSGVETGPPGAQEYNPSDDFAPSTPADLKAMDFEALLATAEREHQKEWEEMKIHKQTGITSGSSGVSSSTMAQQHPWPQHQQQQPNVAPLKIANSASKAIRSAQQQQQQPPQRNTVAFDLGPSDDGGTGTGTGTGTGSDRSMRSKRVMKKKMSVIRLTGSGNVQGRREDDGVIRVSMSPSPGMGAAVVGGRDSTQTPTHLYTQNQWRQ